MTKGTNVGIAAQDCYWEREGAFTGEISTAMIKDAGAGYVIIGHSERRRLFGDTDAWVKRKIGAVLANDLTPIVCVGETLEERDANQTLAVLDRQLDAALAGLTPAQVGSLVDRVRAGVGDRNRPQRHPRPGGRGSRAHPGPAPGDLRPGGCRGLPRALWRER